jgi:sRNA-binding carbon storage regulator CsrA
MALILTRRAGESILIGDNITMTVREIHPKKIYVDFGNKTHWLPLDGGYTSTDPICTVVVTGINRTQVRLAFDADKSVNIVRTELLQ